MIALATVPLEKLPLASLDLETTGLAPKHDRIVQIGLVNLCSTAVEMDMLVKPPMPIPPQSTSIHGIDDASVADAKPIAHSLPKLRDKLNNKVILGYNIGFDLAVLDAEAKRHGLEWGWDTALCVRQLSLVLLGSEAMMMMGDLNALAEHYGVEISNRHTAVGDAIITGRVFYAMLPDLRKKGVVTLGDALRAVSELEDLRRATVRAGWVDVAGLLHQDAPSKSVERIDPYPYRHRIGEMMLGEPVLVPADTQAQKIAALMKEKGIDCVFVGMDLDRVEGIVSERDLVHIMALPVEQVGRAREIPVGRIMSAPVITVLEDDFMHVALGRINRLDIRHLGVVDTHGTLKGWISSRELMRQRVTDAIVIGDQIAQAQNASDMADALNGLPQLAKCLLNEGVEAYKIAAIISGEYRHALAQAAVLAEALMPTPPPCEYAVLVLGSAGRGESLLAADQDHAIVYASPSDEAQAWFETLGGHIADILNDAGIPYCTGGVMSSQPKWCRTLDDWRHTINSWAEHATPEDLLSVDIFFDFEPVHGSIALAGELRQITSAPPTRKADFLKLLAQNTGNAIGGLTLFGGLKKNNAGRYEIKRHLLLPLTESLRVLAIARGIDRRNSANRAEALQHSGTVPPEIPVLAEDIHFALKLVLRQQITDISAGLAPSATIEVDRISKGECKLLKSILKRTQYLETALQNTLFD